MLNEQELDLVIWDLYGEDDFQEGAGMSYFRGASGYSGWRRWHAPDDARHGDGAARGRRPQRLGASRSCWSSTRRTSRPEWALDDGAVVRLMQSGWRVLRTSAKTGAGVEEAFTTLGNAMLAE